MADRRQFRDLAPPEDAREVIDSLDLRPDDETVPLREARGRVLAERVDADLDVPGFDRASVDGYAVQAADTFGADEANPARLELVGEIHAGQLEACRVGLVGAECVGRLHGVAVDAGTVEPRHVEFGVDSLCEHAAPGLPERDRLVARSEV